MSLDFDPIYLIYLLIAVSAGLFVEGAYLLAFSGTSYRDNVNRRLKLLKNEPNRENILVQLRKERGLTNAGDYRIGLEFLNKLVLQSGLTIGLGKFLIFVAVGAAMSFGLGMFFRGSLLEALADRPVVRHRAALSGAAHSARAAVAGFWRAVSRRSRHDRAQPARRSSRSDRDHHGCPGNERSDRQRIRHCRGRDHLWLRSRNRLAQSLFPHRPGRSAAVRDRRRHSRGDRRQSRRNPGEPVGRHSRSLQDAAQDPRAGVGRACIGHDSFVAADRHVSDHPAGGARFLCQRLA